VSSKLSKREEVFAREYLRDLNGKRAAIAAGYSESTAEAQASRLLRKSKVKALVAELTEKKFEKLNISAEWVLGELRKLAGYDAGAIFNDDGSLKPIKEWDASARAALVGLDHEKLFEHFGKGQAKHVGATVKVKLADKLRALELLGKYLKLFTEKVELDATTNFTEALARVLDRKRKHG
jgi:phage terminase small subunit